MEAVVTEDIDGDGNDDVKVSIKYHTSAVSTAAHCAWDAMTDKAELEWLRRGNAFQPTADTKVLFRKLELQ